MIRHLITQTVCVSVLLRMKYTVYLLYDVVEVHTAGAAGEVV